MIDAIGGPRGVTAGDIPTHEVMQIKTNNTAMMKTYLLYGGTFNGEIFTIQKQKYNPENINQCASPLLKVLNLISLVKSNFLRSRDFAFGIIN